MSKTAKASRDKHKENRDSLNSGTVAIARRFKQTAPTTDSLQGLSDMQLESDQKRSLAFPQTNEACDRTKRLCEHMNQTATFVLSDDDSMSTSRRTDVCWMDSDNVVLVKKKMAKERAAVAQQARKRLGMPSRGARNDSDDSGDELSEIED